ncbi:MAG: hypothetical protein JSW61_04515 [Candidatus Thorarchaeota archaeon]|nr:MAG: hypothetical protein JSW61_04515 [Candidatus Thorarchaeota archaeon]
MDLHDVFAASTIGFSWAYFNYQETLTMLPGALYDQLGSTLLLSQLYGLNLTLYLSSDSPGIGNVIDVYESWGVNVGLLDGENDAFSLIEESIDNGYPLVISVDPAWLPADDYDILREQGITGGGHGVVVVGYNKTLGIAYISDPGVGSFGEEFGYPDDGRGNYSEITYTALNSAWANRYYITLEIRQNGEGPEDVGSILGPAIRDRLLGNPQTYAPDSPDALIGSFGETGFRALSSDMTSAGLEEYLSQFWSWENPEEFLAIAFVAIGIGLEAQLTLQYLSYRAALESIQTLMPDYDLSEFIAAGEEALPHFVAMADNRSLVNPGGISERDSLVFGTFFDIAEEFNATVEAGSSEDPLGETLEQFTAELDIISNHLLGIADSWLAAGNELESIWPSNPITLYGPLLLVAGVGVVGLVLLVIMVVRRRPSQ